MVMSQCGPVNHRSHHARGIRLLKLERPWTNYATEGEKEKKIDKTQIQADAITTNLYKAH